MIMEPIKFRLIYRNVHYNFLLRGKYNIVSGFSASGKTLLTKLIDQKHHHVKMQYDGPGEIYSNYGATGNRLLRLLKSEQGCVFVLDENAFMYADNDFYSLIISSPNYFILESREGLAQIPYGLEDIYDFEENNHAIVMTPSYSMQKRISAEPAHTIVICEDKGNGFTCASNLLGKYGYTVVTANGKDNIVNTLNNYSEYVVIILADIYGLNRTSSMLMNELQLRNNVFLCNSLSFEYCALKSQAISSLFKEPVESIPFPSSIFNFPSEEQYYIDLLDASLHEGYGLAYKKNSNIICSLLCYGHAQIQKQHINTSYRVTSDLWFYPEVPRTKGSVKSNKIQNRFSGISEMNLE